MPDKKKDENEDVKFDTAELASDDLETADKAREKRNSPAPESIREDLDKTSWPVTEGRKPAVMRADKEADHDYQLETYGNVDEKARQREVRSAPGAEARAVSAKALNELSGKSANDYQAPPSEPAVAAAEGEGAPKVTRAVATEKNKK